MPDSGFVFSPAFRVVDASIDAVAGGRVEFYEAGTSTAKTVYSDSGLSTSLGSTVYLDSAGHPVSTQGGSTKVVIYTGSALIKLVVKDADGATVATYDNVKCAPDTSSFGTGDGGGGVAGVIAKAADYAILAADDGKVIMADPTGGAFTLTLPSASTVGDGFEITLTHAGTTTANPVKVATVSSQTVAHNGVTAAALALSEGGESMTLASDGANWKAVTHTPPRIPYGATIQVTDRRTSPPASPVAGAWYIINGTPTGDWITYANHDLVRANGIGGWTRYTPPTDCGWLAYVKDEDLLVQFRGSAWVDLSNITAPSTSSLSFITVQYSVSNGTAGGAASGSWGTRPINTIQTNITGTAPSISSNTIINVPAGTYAWFLTANFYGVTHSQARITGSTAGVLGYTTSSAIDPANAANENNCTGSGRMTLAVADTIFIEDIVGGATGANDRGVATSFSGQSEVYLTLTLINLSSMQGPTGAQGPQGNNGLDGTSAGLVWNFATSTTMGDPSSGNFRLNNATLSSVTAAAIADNCGETGNPDVAAWVLTWDDSSTTSDRATLTLRNGNDFAIYTISGASTDNTGWTQLALTYVTHSGSFSASDPVSLSVARTGNIGATGAAGATGATGATGAPGGVTSFNGATGVVTVTLRDVLSGNRSYFIRTDGSDSNNGLANTSGGAFLTLNKFFNVLATIDLNGFNVTCAVAAGTYASSVTVKGPVGIGTVTMTGDTTTPANVIIGGTVRYDDWPAQVQMRGLRFTAASPIRVTNANLYLEAIEFGASGTLIEATRQGKISVFGAIRFTAGGLTFCNATYHGQIYLNNSALNATVSTAMSGWWMRIGTGGLVAASAISITGTTTGTRHYINGNGILEAAGTMPGDVAGSTATGGQVV